MSQRANLLATSFVAFVAWRLISCKLDCYRCDTYKMVANMHGWRTSDLIREYDQELNEVAAHKIGFVAEPFTLWILSWQGRIDVAFLAREDAAAFEERGRKYDDRAVAMEAFLRQRSEMEASMRTNLAAINQLSKDISDSTERFKKFTESARLYSEIRLNATMATIEDQLRPFVVYVVKAYRCFYTRNSTAECRRLTCWEREPTMEHYPF